jgi:hypothetical protein
MQRKRWSFGKGLFLWVNIGILCYLCTSTDFGNGLQSRYYGVAYNISNAVGNSACILSLRFTHCGRQYLCNSDHLIMWVPLIVSIGLPNDLSPLQAYVIAHSLNNDAEG